MNKLVLLSALFSVNAFATPVNINSADAKTISESLAGINLKKAENIVADRIQNGEFKSLTDLKRVFGIGEKTIAINKADILFSNSQIITSHATKMGRSHVRTRGRHGHTQDRLEN